ncbi:hypothetical protein JAO73_06730 [Hymenobacter sp. BT523]|uniref:hypothetical protein n=1 Tax=Hymenobacter sp. BT523 TaxID=2795725 RepID=UPI0018ED2175|nr:hypothetical protein [Hymenobacter sp. BT523]MBJ6108695.1 hypothetical protein [Hymenobacter sp. BT523]
MSEGETFPANYTDVCYTNPAQFSLGATDQSVSNFLYQMSRTSPNPLKVTFGTLPKRVNVPASGRAFGDFSGYAQDAISAAHAQFPTFNWGQYDQRTNNPGFGYDNSTTGPDGELDYVIFCFRVGCHPSIRKDDGVAGVFPVTIPANASHPAYAITTGHCQAGSTLGWPSVLHELAHTLYGAPHVLGANSTTGNHYYGTLGWSMMQNAATSFSAAAWERWYLGWTELKTSPGQVSSDIGPGRLAPNGTYVLRDYVTTGDVMRLELPNTNQYLWLENRAKNGPLDRRNGYVLAPDGNAYLPAPQGLLAMVENMSPSRTSFVGPFNNAQVNGLRVVSAEGNFDYRPSGPFTR